MFYSLVIELVYIIIVFNTFTDTNPFNDYTADERSEEPGRHRCSYGGTV